MLRYLFITGIVLLSTLFNSLCQESIAFDNDVLKIIHQRKSVRSYTGEQVDSLHLIQLVKAGMAAPSAMNRQPWFFVIIEDKEILNDLGESIMFGKMLKEASAAIVVCGNMRNVYSLLPDYWIQDCSAATQNILLAAEATGLGAVWIGLYPQKTRSRKVRKTLDLPRHIVPLNIISIGYPTGVDRPKDKWDENKIKWNR